MLRSETVFWVSCDICNVSDSPEENQHSQKECEEDAVMGGWSVVSGVCTTEGRTVRHVCPECVKCIDSLRELQE